MKNLTKKNKIQSTRWHYWSVLLIVFLASCYRYSSEQLTKAYKISGNNKKEIENFISFFSTEKRDSLKYRAAIYIVENMLNHETISDNIYDRYSESIMQHKMPIGTKSLDSLWRPHRIHHATDLMYLKGEYLIQDIQTAFAIRDSVSWGKDIPFAIFQEYVLPYKVLREKFIPDWRNIIYEQYKHLLDGTNSPEEAYAKVLTYLKKNTREANSNFSHDIDVLTMDHLKRGSCSQLNVYFILVLRSLGIPVAYDYVEHWGNYSLVGHSWVSYIDKAGMPLTLADKDSVARKHNRIDASYFKEHYTAPHSGYSISQFKTVSKVYRHSYKSQKKNGSNIFFKEQQDAYTRQTDVSAHYGITDSVMFTAQNGDEIASLSIFLTGGDWKEFAYIDVENNQFKFSNLGKNVVYLPIVYRKGGKKKIGAPFYINNQSEITEFKPSKELEQIRLKRKYPLFGSWTYMWNRMVGGRIEVSETEYFMPSREIYTITELPIGCLSINLSVPIKIKNIRYVCPPACRTPIAEFIFYDHDGNKIDIAKALGEAIPDDQLELAFDNNELTSAVTKKEAYWIGAKLNPDQQLISKIDLVPKNDGNFITKTDTYHLYYFDKKWISLGRRIAQDRYLEYDNVPKGAVLLLRNLTEGKEERIFTIKDSIQIWW